MSEKEQIIEIIKKFLNIADELLKNGKIDGKTYDDITFNKKKFLKDISSEN